MKPILLKKAAEKGLLLVDLTDPIEHQALGLLRPAPHYTTSWGSIYSAWKPSWKELLQLAIGRPLWVGFMEENKPVAFSLHVGQLPQGRR